jgi:hypothetical protein
MFYALKIAKYGTILNSFYQKKRKTVNHKPNLIHLQGRLPILET